MRGRSIMHARINGSPPVMILLPACHVPSAMPVRDREPWACLCVFGFSIATARGWVSRDDCICTPPRPSLSRRLHGPRRALIVLSVETRLPDGWSKEQPAQSTDATNPLHSCTTRDDVGRAKRSRDHVCSARCRTAGRAAAAASRVWQFPKPAQRSTTRRDDACNSRPVTARLGSPWPMGCRRRWTGRHPVVFSLTACPLGHTAAYRASGCSITRLFGKHVFPRHIAMVASGLLFFGATTYDVHRFIKNNERPPTREQMEALQDYIDSKKQ